MQPLLQLCLYRNLRSVGEKKEKKESLGTVLVITRDCPFPTKYFTYNMKHVCNLGTIETS